MVDDAVASAYAAETMQAAWDHHFAAVGSQDVSYTDDLVEDYKNILAMKELHASSL